MWVGVANGVLSSSAAVCCLTLVSCADLEIELLNVLAARDFAWKKDGTASHGGSPAPLCWINY